MKDKIKRLFEKVKKPGLKKVSPEEMEKLRKYGKEVKSEENKESSQQEVPQKKKKAWVDMKIGRVPLNPEQAVLSCCLADTGVIQHCTKNVTTWTRTVTRCGFNTTGAKDVWMNWVTAGSSCQWTSGGQCSS